MDRALTHYCRTTQELIGFIDSLSTFRLTNPAKEHCLDCHDPNCAAWIALRCGGCNRTFWLEQSLLWELWCHACEQEHRWGHSWQEELRRQTGINPYIALSLYESPEQKILAYYRWEVQCVVKRIKVQSKSRIIAVRCRKVVPLTQRSVVGPFEGSPERALDCCIEKLQTLSLQEAGPVKVGATRLKTDKKRKKKQSKQKKK